MHKHADYAHNKLGGTAAWLVPDHTRRSSSLGTKLGHETRVRSDLKIARWRLNKENSAMDVFASPRVSCSAVHAITGIGDPVRLQVILR